VQPNDTFDAKIFKMHDRPGRHSELVNFNWLELIEALGAWQSSIKNPVVGVEIHRYPSADDVRQVPSASSDRVYTVTNDTHCTCPGFMYRGYCKHTRKY